jgi:hypothetical protein
MSSLLLTGRSPPKPAGGVAYLLRTMGSQASRRPSSVHPKGSIRQRAGGEARRKKRESLLVCAWARARWLCASILVASWPAHGRAGVATIGRGDQNKGNASPLPSPPLSHPSSARASGVFFFVIVIAAGGWLLMWPRACAIPEAHKGHREALGWPMAQRSHTSTMYSQDGAAPLLQGSREERANGVRWGNRVGMTLDGKG